MVVGISGKYCAGKSTVAALLAREWDFLEIDVDRLGHDALREQKDEVAERFGGRVLTDGEIDRSKLGRIVFGDAGALSALEAIVHPRMVSMAERRIATHSERDVAVNAAILFKMGLDRLCDSVIWVEAPLVMRFRRARERDGLPALQILKRFYAQRGMKPQPSSSGVDIHTVRNSGNLDDLKRRLRTVLVV